MSAGRRCGAARCSGSVDLDRVAACSSRREARATVPSTVHAPVGDEAGGLGAGKAELVGEEAVEALGRVRQHREADDRGLRRWLIRRSRSPDRRRVFAPERDRERERAAADGDVGDVERRPAVAMPTPTSMKSTTPRELRIRSIRLPTAPPATSPQRQLAEPVARQSPSATAQSSTNTASTANAEEDPAGVRAEVQPERRALVVDQAQLEPVADHRDAGDPQQVRLRRRPW